MARYPYLESDGRFLAIAHRGGRPDSQDDNSPWPENTLAAFQHAVDLGYRYVETDVHLTRDGVLIVFHDDRLDRVTERQGRISKMSWPELQDIRVAGEPIATLEALLHTWPELRINIDPKSDAAVPVLAETLKRAGAVGRVGVGSFKTRRLIRLRKALGPDLCTSMGPLEVVRFRATSLGIPLGRFKTPGCLQVPVKQGPVKVVDERLLRAAHARGLQVHVWTVNDAAEMERLIDLGVDGIVTDHTATLKRVLQSRRRW